MYNLVIIRGLPGTGKAYAAKHYPLYKCFVEKNKMDCYVDVHTALNHNDVVVTNTFTTIKEMEHYLALSHKATIKVICLKSSYGDIHNVPMAIIKERFTQNMETCTNPHETTIYGNPFNVWFMEQTKEKEKDMDLERMLELLNKVCNHSMRHHEEILKTLDLPLYGSVKDYVNQIKNDPILWFCSFPKGCKSKEALAKAELGLLYLLKMDYEVRADLGVEYCDDLAMIIHRKWGEYIGGGKDVVLSRSSRTDDLDLDLDLERERKIKELVINLGKLDDKVIMMRGIIDAMQVEQEKLIKSNKQLEIDIWGDRSDLNRRYGIGR